MPIYEYKCENCEELFEKISSIENAAEQIIECPKCKKLLAHKIPSIFNSIYNNRNDDNLRKEKPNGSKEIGKGHTIKMGPYSGFHIDEPVKNMEISDLNFKMSDTSSFSVHPEAKVKIKNCKFESDEEK